MLENMVMVYVKNHAQPTHWHDMLEINLVLNGEMDVTSRDRVYKVRAGEIIVINQNYAHSIKRYSDDLLYVQLHMNLTDFNYYIPDISESRFNCTPAVTSELKSNLKRYISKAIAYIVRYAENPETIIDVDGKVVYYSLEILGSLNVFFPEKTMNELKEDESIDEKALWKVIEYFRENISDSITLEEVAEQTGKSEDAVNERIREIHGVDFDGFIDFTRAVMSVGRLLKTDRSVTEIARECGFMSAESYMEVFREVYRCGPEEYRNRSRKYLLEMKRGKADSVVFDEEETRDIALALLKSHEYEGEKNPDSERRIVVDIRALEGDGEHLKRDEIVFNAQGQNSIWNYNMQWSLKEIGRPYMMPDDDIYVWRERDTVKILFAGGIGSDMSNVVLRVEGLDEKATYIFCRKKTADIPASLREIVFFGSTGNLDHDILYNIHEMACEYGEFHRENRVYFDVALKEEQLEKIIIQKISK